MNPTIDTLLAHRSIRAFAPDPVPPEHLKDAIHAGQMASTSSAVQACCAIQINDPDTRAQIAELAGNQPYVASAPAFLLFCGDSRRHRLACEAAGHGYEARLEAFLIAAIDTSLFAQNTAAALESMGYGICYIGGIRNDLPRLDRLLDIPEGVYPFFGMCIGKPDPGRRTSTRPRLPMDGVLMQDRYSDDDAMLGVVREYDEIYREYLRARSAPDAQIEAAWAARMAQMYDAPRRTGLAAYFESKGARLD